MKIFPRISFFLFAALSLMGCRKSDYESNQVTEPVFICSGSIDGQAISLAGGDDNLIATSDVRINDLGVTEYTGNLRDAHCPNCSPQFEVAIFNETNVSDSSQMPFSLGLIRFAESTTEQRLRHFRFHAIGGNEGFAQWDFGDGTNGYGHEVNHTFPAGGSFDVTLTWSAFGQQQSVVEQTILSGSLEPLAYPFSVSIENADLAMAQLPELAEASHLQPLYWSLNGVNVGLPSAVSFHPGDEVRLEFQHEVTGAMGHFALRQMTSFSPSLGSFAAQPNIQWLHGSRVRLRYTDSAGVAYHSCLEINDHEHFEILAVDEGEPDWFDGTTSKKITFQLRGWLVNEQDPSDQVYIDQLEGTLGFKLQ